MSQIDIAMRTRAVPEARMSAGLGRPWQHTLWRLSAAIGAALLLGFLTDRVWQALALVLAAILLWHYVQLQRTLSALRTRRRLGPAQGWGIFAELAQLLYRRQREGRARKLRLLRLLRAFRQAAAALPDATVVLDANEYRILWFNEAATRLLGLRYPQDLGIRLSNLVRAPRAVSWLAGGGVEPLMDLPSPVDEGLRLSLRMIDYTDRERLLVARDITKLMHLEQVRRDFVANVSHELRTPLTVVHGYLDMIDPDDAPEIAGMLREMRNQSRRMTQIVEDLLTLSRLEAQDHITEERIAMRAMLETLRREAVALSAGQHRIEVRDEAGCDLRGSAKELHSAFSNLVTNAVRYTPAGGSITIALENEDGGVRVAVTDTGHGIPPQHLPRITERFYRVSTSRSRETGGTGLGLSIVKHVLNLHHARLGIESEVGRGSVFACHFGAERVMARECEAGEAA